MSKDLKEVISIPVETVEKMQFKIRLYTYDNGYSDFDFYAEDYDNAKRIADEIYHSYNNSWYWNWL